MLDQSGTGICMFRRNNARIDIISLLYTAIFASGMADNMAGIETDVNYSETKLQLSNPLKHSDNLSHFTHRLIC